MRKAWQILCCAVAAAAMLVAPALAVDPPPLPTLPTVTLPTPTLPTPRPTPTVPVTVPVVTAPIPAPPSPPVKLPSTPPPDPNLPRVPSGSGSTGSSGSSASGGTALRPSRVGRARVAVSRRWASPHAKRPTAIVITLRAAGVVELRVTELAPRCRAAGLIVVRGHAGRNVVLFRGRVGGQTLEPGTYRITLRLRGGRQLRSLLVVVVAGRTPAPGEVASARVADACAARRDASGSLASISAPVLARSGGTKLAVALPATRLHPSRTGGVLGADFTRTLRDPTSVSPVLLILLAIAICLLGLAALPRSVVASPVLAEQLTHRRHELALAGTATLLVVVLSYMIF